MCAGCSCDCAGILSDVSEFCSDDECVSVSGVYFAAAEGKSCNENVSCSKTDDEVYDSSEQWGSVWASDDDDTCEN